MLEEEERKKKEREAAILNSLSAQEVPPYRIEVSTEETLFCVIIKITE